MNEKKQIPQSDYSVDEILAEAHIMEGRGAAKMEQTRPAGTAADKGAADAGISGTGGSMPLNPDEIARSAKEALDRSAGGETPPEETEPVKTKKKKHFSFFHRKKSKDSTKEMEDDIYYGLQLKPLEEYRREYESTLHTDAEAAKGGRAAQEEPEKKSEAEEKQPKTQESAPDSSFPYLFGPEEEEDPELADTVQKIRQERHERLEKIMQHAGLNSEDVFGLEESGPRPETPGNPPRPAQPPMTEPPAPPSVQPGPIREPEIRPPLAQPPAEPKSPEVPPPGPLKAEESPKTAKEPEKPPKTEKKPEPENKEKPAECSPEEPSAPIREPAAAPAPVKEEGTLPPQEKEPDRRPVPPYRAVTPPLHVIELKGIEDALAAEAAAYAVPESKKPEPISFPKEHAEKQLEPEAVKREEPPAEEPEKPPAETEPPVTEPPEEPIPFSAPENGQPESEPPEKPKRKKGFRLFGSDEDTTPLAENPLKNEDELDDYQNPDDAPSILNDLSSKVRGLTLRLVVTGLCAAVLLGFSVIWEYPAIFPPGLHSLYGVQAFLFIHLIFLLISCGFCIQTIANGFRGLFTFQANSDSAVAVAAAAALIQNAVYLISGLPDSFHLYSALAAAALFLNTAGKLSMMRRILRNFRFVSSPGQKYSVQMYSDYNTALRLSQGTQINEPKIAYQTKTGFLRNFLRISYAPDPSDHSSQTLAPAGFIASLALCIVAAVLSKDAGTALTAFAASACVCVPFPNMLSVNLPLARLNKIASRYGGMAAGWPAVDAFSQTNAVMMDATDLFPRGTVILNGIQTFEGQRIDEAILDATALTSVAGGTLNDLFNQIIKSRNEVLPQVERPAYEDGMGISGTVRDHVILIGNRRLLGKHGVDAPPLRYEEKYIRAGKIPVYLASGGILVAMFLVSYRSDRRRATELRRLEYNGISLIVRTRDPNITPEFLSECFGISEHSSVVLPEKLGNVYTSLQASPPERSPALVATKGRTVSMMRLLTACVRQRGNISIAVALQTAGAALGFALTAFFTCYAGLKQLSVTALALFEAFWVAAVFVVPRLRRP